MSFDVKLTTDRPAFSNADVGNWKQPLNGVWFIEVDGYTDYANLTPRVRG
jgi:hypothetical protein